jgi:chromosome segregation ATPase
MFDLNPTYITLITAIFGGAGVEVLKKIVSRQSEATSDATKIRDELRLQIESLHRDINDARHESDEWREKYWAQVKENVGLRGDLEALRVEIMTLKEKPDTSSQPE